MNQRDQLWIVWGSELSPFTLKVMRLFRHAQLPFRFLPTEGRWLENWRYTFRLRDLKSGKLPMTWPQMTPDDELPLVPFVFGADGSNLYDSTAIAHWLDRELAPERRLVPEDAAAGFIAQLIDDYADEFLLCVVHHNRWVLSARNNDAGKRLAREYRTTLGPLQPWFARWFAARQTRRLPYLFSTPGTRALLDDAFLRLLGILEKLLAQRPFILGKRFTLADAAIYGQLGMNLADPEPDRLMRERAPGLHAWLTALNGAAPVESGGKLMLDTSLKPLLAEICRVHIPLMRQNAAAHARMKQAGVTRFNEPAFDRGEALYDGVIDGHPYRTVAKSFQARAWSDCLKRWHQLSSADRAKVQALLPTDHGLSAH